MSIFTNDSSIETNEKYLLIPPARYGLVAPGISRGSYPTIRSYRFLSRLQLKTIVSLTPEYPMDDLVAFGKSLGANNIHIPVSRTHVIGEQLHSILIRAINLIIDTKNHPIYIHCLDGRKITGLLVVLFRRLQGWNPYSSISEFWRYQSGFRGPIPSSEIEKTTKEIELFASELVDVTIPDDSR